MRNQNHVIKRRQEPDETFPSYFRDIYVFSSGESCIILLS